MKTKTTLSFEEYFLDDEYYRFISGAFSWDLDDFDYWSNLSDAWLLTVMDILAEKPWSTVYT